MTPCIVAAILPLLWECRLVFERHIVAAIVSCVLIPRVKRVSARQAGFRPLSEKSVAVRTRNRSSGRTQEPRWLQLNAHTKGDSALRLLYGARDCLSCMRIPMRAPHHPPQNACTKGDSPQTIRDAAWNRASCMHFPMRATRQAIGTTRQNAARGGAKNAPASNRAKNVPRFDKM